MPTAAKLEKQASTEGTDSLKQAMTVLEHKIRNLEKRKRKIESYRDEQSKGQTLNSDQLLAVSKYDEVTKTLDFAQDLYKQFQVISTECVKTAKKQQRKELLERMAQDVSKVKEILLVQDILQGMGQDNAREDFLAGRNFAIQLTDTELKHLDDIFVEVAPKRSTPDDGLPPFPDQLTAAAEHLLYLVEGKQKEVVGTSYSNLKDLFNRIQECSYFDQPTLIVAPAEVHLDNAELVNAVVQAAEQVEGTVTKDDADQPKFTAPMPPAPLAKSLPIPSNLVPAPSSASSDGAGPSSSTPAAVEAYFATTPRVSESAFNIADQQQSVNELIKTVSGAFNFLQESELDADPGVIGAVQLPVSTISSQTYTNQSFPAVQAPTVAPLPQAQPAVYPVGVAELNQPIAGFPTVSPNPPPPIPMPPSHRSSQYAAAPAQVGPSHGGPTHTAPSQGGVHAVASCHAGLARTVPRAASARVAVAQAALAHAGQAHAGPAHVGPGLPGPGQGGPAHPGQSHAGGGHAGPSHAGAGHGAAPHLGQGHMAPAHPGPAHMGAGPAHAGPAHGGPGGAAHAGAVLAEFHHDQPHAPLPHVEAWGGIGDAAVGAAGAPGAAGGGGEWNPNTVQPGEWAAPPPNDGQAHRTQNPRPGHRGNRGGGSRGGNSPGGFGSRGSQSRQGNYNNGNRNPGSYGNYPRSQEGHAGAGLGNASYYQHQNGYQQQHSQAQQPQQQQLTQTNREQLNTNGNYTSYRSRPAQRAPGTRGPSRGGVANDGGVSNQRAARGTAYVGGGGGRPHMNRQ